MRKFAKDLLSNLCLAAMLIGVAHAATDKQKLQERLRDATDVVHALITTPDKGIPLRVASRARCVIVVPGYKKGAFIVGGQYGQGLVTCRTGRGP